jgi:opacity protein-like surface antigen
MKKLLAAVALAALVASPALAQTPRQARQQSAAENQIRTCGFDTIQYDSEGTPTGPYCH